MVDTNSDPTLIDFPVPANDDASKSIDLITRIMVKAIEEGLVERKMDKDKKDKEKEEMEAAAELVAKEQQKEKEEEKKEAIEEKKLRKPTEKRARIKRTDPTEKDKETPDGKASDK